MQILNIYFCHAGSTFSTTNSVVSLILAANLLYHSLQNVIVIYCVVQHGIFSKTLRFLIAAYSNLQ